MLVSELLEAKKKKAAPEPAADAKAPATWPPKILRTIRLSSQFIKDWPTFKKAFPSAAKALRNFMFFRATNEALQGWGQKDSPSKHVLKGYWHVHLVYGKVIVFYTVSEQYLDLLAVTDHLTLDDIKRMKNLADRLNGMDPTTFAHTPLPFT